MADVTSSKLRVHMLDINRFYSIFLITVLIDMIKVRALRGGGIIRYM
jgi:hypothetical protein